MSSVAYAQRIERGWSPKAPDGVYQVAAALARDRYGDQFGVIRFEYRSFATFGRQPAIIVRPR